LLFGIRTTSETAAYTFVASLAIPHCTPPLTPPLPTRVCQTISPLRAGSTAVTTPDFCPATSRSRPPAVTSNAEDPKSKSGPFSEGQLPELLPQAELYASPDVTCLTQRIFPVLMSSAMNASLVFVGGVE